MGENKTEEVTYLYASASDRAISFIRDYVAILLPISILIVLHIIVKILFGIKDDSFFVMIIYNFVYIFVGIFGYSIRFLVGCLHDFNATISQNKKNMFIVNEDGSYLSNKQIIIRSILYLFSGGFSIINLLFISSTKKHQSLIDILLKQVVLKETE